MVPWNVSIEQRTSARCNRRNVGRFLPGPGSLNRAAHFRALQRKGIDMEGFIAIAVSIEQRTSARCNRGGTGRERDSRCSVSIEQRTSARCNPPSQLNQL